MAGIKTFTNTTGAALQIMLFIREGPEYYNQDGTVSFTLAPFEELDVSYGTDSNIYLNGILLFTIFQGSVYSSMQFVNEGGNVIDNALNMNSYITISLVNTVFVYEFH
ncbi:hypothetical protein [Paenibacillus silvisoli]|uniref:hypothetical protein n=1 Tax=Paenibacillus silvisoli TaxID=3110539 RepID=UPI002804B6CE|nr:hypothetical protein [Paenibacillus silvisoli]